MLLNARAMVRWWGIALVAACVMVVNAADPAWTSAGRLNVARANHTATLHGASAP